MNERTTDSGVIISIVYLSGGPVKPLRLKLCIMPHPLKIIISQFIGKVSCFCPFLMLIGKDDACIIS